MKKTHRCGPKLSFGRCYVSVASKLRSLENIYIYIFFYRVQITKIFCLCLSLCLCLCSWPSLVVPRSQEKNRIVILRSGGWDMSKSDQKWPKVTKSDQKWPFSKRNCSATTQGRNKSKVSFAFYRSRAMQNCPYFYFYIVWLVSNFILKMSEKNYVRETENFSYLNVIKKNIYIYLF